MKGMKGKFLKKLKSIRPMTSLKSSRVLQVNASDGFFFPHCNNRVPQNPPICKEQDDRINPSNLSKQEPEIIDISELMKDLEEEEEEMELREEDVGDKENIGLPIKPKDMFPLNQNRKPEASIIIPEPARCHLRNDPLSDLDVSSLRRPDPPPVDHNLEIPQSAIRPDPLSEIDISSFRGPDLNSGSLFDPNLLAVFEQGVMDHIKAYEAERKSRAILAMDTKERKPEPEPEPPSKSRRIEDNLLLEFDEKCPPGGIDSVILYTTSLRGVRKTFEDCHSIKFLLGSFRVLFYERDVSMHSEFREELWRILEGRVIPPRLFIKGRYIGGADEVVGLHEQGKLKQLLQGLPAEESDGPCCSCAGIRFVLCFNCSGSRKIIPEVGEDEEEMLPSRCPDCNENGLIVCPICC